MTPRWLAVCALCACACARERPPPPRGVLTISVEQQSSWVRNFNPLAPPGASRWPTQTAIYEPLFVFNTVTGEYVPWLATSFAWERDAHLLRLKIRQGVQWSDGTPFTARDVAYTFRLLKQHPALDRAGIWTFVSAVRAPDDTTVEVDFPRPFLPGLADLAIQAIIPEHVWSRIADPLTFPNPDPVATGPFTQVRVFQNQIFELGKNPRYWQPGKPALEALRFPAYPSNERANLALVFDEAEWAGNFVPAVDRVFVGRDPKHHRYWFPLIGSTIFLYPNAARPPYDDVRVRKALSLAIDRKLLIDVALHGYSRAADATGLSDAYTKWHSADAAASGDWVQHDPARAEALLDEAGLRRGPDGVRTRGGVAFRVEVLTVAGWSDWIRAAQVIARGLRAVGVDVVVRAYDFSAWYERLQEGRFDLSLGWSVEGPTPYTFYRWLMASATVKPIGTAANGNWQRYGSHAADALLEQFEREQDPAAQRRLSDGLQRVFAAEAPAIPLYPNPSWGEFNDARFEGFPTAQDPFAPLSPNKIPEALLVLTALRPRD